MKNKIQLIVPVLAVCFLSYVVGWKQKQQYTFKLDARNVAGIPDLKNQFSGLDIDGEIVIQVHDSTTLLIKFSNMTFTKLHGAFEAGWWADTSSYNKNKTDQLPMSKYPLVVQLERNEVKILTIPSSMDTWEINFAKGVIKQLIPSGFVNRNQEHSGYSNSLSKSSKLFTQGDFIQSFTKIEESVFGRCEVLYDIVKIPHGVEGIRDEGLNYFRRTACDNRSVYAITKTYNFSNCDHLVQNTRGHTFDNSPLETLLKRASLNRMIGCGNSDNFILLESVTSSTLTANVQVHHDSQAVIYSKLNITLLRFDSDHEVTFKRNIPKSVKQVHDFMYSYPPNRKDLGACNSKYPKSVSDPEQELDQPEDDTQSLNANKNYRNDRRDRYSDAEPDYGTKSEPEEHNRPKRSRSSRKNRNKKTKEQSSELDEGLNKDERDESYQHRSLSYDEANDASHQSLSPYALPGKGDQKNCLHMLFKDMIEELSNDILNKKIATEDGMVEKISISSEMCQLLSFKELLQVSDSMFYAHSVSNKFSLATATKRDVFRDIIAMCGTKASLSLLNHWLKNKQLSDEETVVILTLLPSRMTSHDKDTVDNYFELVENLSKKQNKFVLTAAVIGFSNYVRISCTKRHNENSSKNKCEPEHVEPYVKWMANMLNEDHDKKMTRVFSLAVGNTGSRSGIKVLKSLANNENLSHYQRSHAILAMRYQALQYPEETAQILFEMYNNYSSPVSIRLSAVSLLVFSKPPLSVWQRIAISTWYEPNLAVTSFIQNTLASISESNSDTNTIYPNMAKNALAVRHLMRPQVDSSHEAVVHNLIHSSYVKHLKESVFEHSSWSGSSEFMNIYHRLSTQFNKLPTSYEGEISTSNPDDLLTALKSLLISPKKDITQARPPIKDLELSTSWIRSNLGLVERKPPRLEGDLRFKVNNVIETILPFDRKSIAVVPYWGKSFLAHLLSTGIQKSVQKISMESLVLSVPTELGLPVQLQIHVPWLLQSNFDLKIVENYNVNAAFDLSLSSGMNGDFGFVTPWDNNAYSAGIHGTCFGQIPSVNFTVHVNTSKSSVSVKTGPIEESRIFYHKTYPFTSQKDLTTNQLTSTSTETRPIHVDEMKKKNIQLNSQFKGVYQTEGKLYNLVELLTQMNLMHHPMSWHSNKFTQIELSMNKMNPVSYHFSIRKATVDEGKLHVEDDDFIDENTEPANAQYFVIADDKTDNESKNNEEEDSRGFFRKIIDWFKGKKSEPSDSSSSETTTSNTTESTTSGGTTIEASMPDSATTETPTNTSATVADEVNLIESNKDSLKTKNDEEKIQSEIFEIDFESFSASMVNPFTKNANRGGYSYLFWEVMNGIKSGQAVVMNLNATVQNPERAENFSVFCTYGSTNMKSLQRIGCFSSGNNSAWTNSLTASLVLPPLPAFNLQSVVLGSTQPSFNIDYVYLNNDYNKTVSVEGLLTHKGSEFGQNSTVEECQAPKSAPLPKCRRIRKLATSVNEIQMSIAVNDGTKSFHMALRDAVDLITQAGKEYLIHHESKPEKLTRNIDNDDNDANWEVVPYNTVKISVRLDDNYRHLNSWINSSTNDIYFKGVPFYSSPSSKTALSLYEELTQQNSQFCGITNRGVRTFDGVRYHYNMTDCWHVAAKDVSGKSRVMILTRALHNSTYLDLEINVDNYKIVKFSEEGIYLNNKKVIVPQSASVLVSDREETPLIRVEQTVDFAYNILMPAHGFNLVYTNTSAIIYAYSGMQNRLAGLCGDYNFETYREFTSPNGVVVNTAYEFAASYSFHGKNCAKYI